MKHLLSVVVSAAAVIGFVTTTSNIEAEPTTTRGSDPMTMSTGALQSAFPAEFAYLQQTYGLTDKGAAGALRLTWSAGNTRKWAMQYVADYAGTWVDYRRAQIFVGVAGGPAMTAAAERRISDLQAPEGVAPMVVPMQRTMRELTETAREVHAAVDPTNSGTVQVGIDDRRGSLTVEGLSTKDATSNPRLRTLLAAPGAPTVRFTEGAATDPSGIGGGWDGRQTVGCTIAFAVVSPSNSRALLTAGHCVDNPLKAGNVTLSLAQYQRSFWPWLGGTADSGYDRQLHVLPAGVQSVGQLDVPHVNISGTFLPAVGSVICRYGASSVTKGQAPVFCSTVVGYGYDGFVGMATGCIYGDSGGPSWVMGKAVGVAAVTTDPEWPVDAASTCWEAPVKDQLNGTGYYVQDSTGGTSSDFRAIGLFHAVNPTRILDTRGHGRALGETVVALDKALPFADLGSVALSVTIVPRGLAGNATVYPGDDGFVPMLNSVSFPATEPESNLVVSRVNRYSRSVNVYTSQSVDLVVDVIGYFSDTSGNPGAATAVRVMPLASTRLYDTRRMGLINGGTSRDIQVRGLAGVPATASSVVVNLTVTQATGIGYLTAHAGGTTVPSTSNLNFTAGQTKARMAIVPLDAQGRMRLSAGGVSSEHVIVDVQGYLEATGSTNTGRTFAVDGGGGRLLDTTATGTPMDAGSTVCVDVYAGRTAIGSGLPRDGLLGVWMSVTVAGATGTGYLVVAPQGVTPGTSNLNFVAGSVRTNSVFVAVPSAANGTVCVKMFGATANVVVDVIALTTV